MKKIFCILLLLLVCGCQTIQVGNFSEKRKHLHEMGNDETYCEKNPDKCINGIPW